MQIQGKLVDILRDHGVKLGSYYPDMVLDNEFCKWMQVPSSCHKSLQIGYNNNTPDILWIDSNSMIHGISEFTVITRQSQALSTYDGDVTTAKLSALTFGKK